VNPRIASPTTATAGALVASAVEPESTRWHWLAFGLLGTALSIGIGLVAVGSPLPDPVTVLVLAALLALAVSRAAFFPTELAVTTEVAVLLAAVVIFRAPSPYIGPLCVALLAGPLDVVHWRQRAFGRMAYNAGNRALSTLTAAAVFTQLASIDVGRGGGRWVPAALVAAVAFAAVEGAIGVVLLKVRGEATWLAAARLELPLDALTVPVGLLGLLAGWLVLDAGWWAGVLVLVPTAFLPELASIPRVLRVFPRLGRVAATALPAGAALAALAAALPAAPPVPAVTVAVVAVTVGLDLRIERPVPPAVAALLVAALLVGGEGFAIIAVLAAVAATVTAWLAAGRASWWAPLLAGGLALVAAAVFDVWPTRAGATAVACAFVVVVSARPGAVAWTLPLVGVASALAVGWAAGDLAGAFLLVAGVVSAARAIADSGTPLWSSRRLGASATGHGHRTRPLVVALTVLALAAAIATGAGAGDARIVLTSIAAAAAATLGAVAVTLARQWRFAPRRRVRDVTVALVGVVVATLVYPDRALAGDGWSVAILAMGLALALWVAWPLCGLPAASGGGARSGRSTRRSERASSLLRASPPRQAAAPSPRWRGRRPPT
jgi:hypothetical protein